MLFDLISRSALKSFFCKCCNILHPEEPCEPSECNVMEVLNEQPAVDAVEVVRCKDCYKRYDENLCPMCMQSEGELSEYTFDDGYCDRGERRADDGK